MGSAATLSPFDPAAEANRLANLFADFSNQVDIYRLALPDGTPDQQLASLKTQAQSLESQSQEFTADAIGATLDAIQNDLAHVREVTTQAKDQLGTLNSVEKAIAIVSSAVDLGAAIATGNPGGILGATEALAQLAAR